MDKDSQWILNDFYETQTVLDLRFNFYSLTFTKFSDFYRGKEEISDIDRVLCHKGAVVRNTIEHDALGVI